MTLRDLNAADRASFVQALGSVFESSPWVAERAWARRPFASVDALHAAMAAEVDAADSDARLALLRAHPDLGSRAAMSALSDREQADAGLHRLPASMDERLGQLTRAYREKFGFPFLLAVRGRAVEHVIGTLELRLPRPFEEEFAEALRQVSRIARFRLETMIGSAS